MKDVLVTAFMRFGMDVTFSDSFSNRQKSPDANVIAHLSVSFYMGFINFDVSYREFYEQRIQRALWLHNHFYNCIPFRFWKRIIDADISISFLDKLLPSDYSPKEELTLTNLIAFLRRFTYWECGDISDIEEYFKNRNKLQKHQK